MQVVNRWLRVVAAVLPAAVLAAGCTTVVNGHPVSGTAGPFTQPRTNAPNANLPVHGDAGDWFDTQAKNALSDIIAFWRQEFPKVSGGRQLQPLKGGFWSVDGAAVAATHNAGPAAAEACIGHNPNFIVDNGAYCTADDSIVWDRAPTHLLAQLAQKYGPVMVALIFAHEFGHAISNRLGVLRRNLPTIDTESQADCAAGAWAGWALKGDAPHFRNITPQKPDAALEGFLDGRDQTPGTPAAISHGNGFDRLSAVADGIDRGATYCYSPGYFASRTFTERPFTDPNDYARGGNSPLADIIDTSPQNPFVRDLNRFWTKSAQQIGKTFTPVKIAQATHPPCDGSSVVEFGYCPSDNTVYFSTTFAQHAYYSLPGVQRDSTGSVQLVSDQPADFALGVLFAIGWGMAVLHQLGNASLSGKGALDSAICYTGAYSRDVNVPTNTPGKIITLSPSDLDEATSAMLDQVGKPQAFGTRGTTGLDRIQDFVKGYRGGLSVC